MKHRHRSCKNCFKRTVFTCKEEHGEERGQNFRGVQQAETLQIVVLGEGEGSRSKLVACPIKDKHCLYGLWLHLTSQGTTVAFGSSGPPAHLLAAHCLHSCISHQVKQSLLCSLALHSHGSRSVGFVSHWVCSGLQKMKWATLRNRRCILMTEK